MTAQARVEEPKKLKKRGFPTLTTPVAAFAAAMEVRPYAGRWVEQVMEPVGLTSDGALGPSYNTQFPASFAVLTTTITARFSRAATAT